MTRRLWLMAVMMAMAGVSAPRAQAPAAQTAGSGTTTTWYFYRVKWGFQDEVEVFQKEIEHHEAQT